MTYIVDLDDQSTQWDAMPYLLALKEKYPKFKVTLFTIPAESTYSDLLKWSSLDWVELALHGWTHMLDNQHNPREMQDWNYPHISYYLGFISMFYPGIFTHGLKAPGWQISDATYKALLQDEYWVMDQHYNDDRRPPELSVYHLNEPGNLHGHTWPCNGGVDNFIGDMIDRGDFDAITPDDDFKFVSEMVVPCT